MRSTAVAICGYGLVGRRHAVAAAAVPGVHIAAVVEPAAEARAAAEAEGFRAFESLDALFAAGGIDGLILATPTPQHLAQGEMALRRGFPVLIEKPIAVTAREGAALVALSAAAGVPVLVGHHRRHNPLIQSAKAIIEAGQIGDIRAVQASCWFYKPDSYFAAAPWRTEPGAGPISVNLAHDIDLIRHLCGEVVRVQASAAPSARGFANEDVAAAVLTLDNGAIVTITVSDSIVAPWSWEMTSKEYPIYPQTDQSCYQIGGSHGALSIPDLRLWRHAGGGQDWWTPISAHRESFAPADPLVAQIAHFRDVIGGAAPLVSAEEGWRTLRVIEAIQRAASSGKMVVLSDAAHAQEMR